MINIKSAIGAKIRKNMFPIISVLLTTFVLGSSYAAWHLYRAWNYTWGYESMVKETVCDMVKPEYLKKPCK